MIYYNCKILGQNDKLKCLQLQINILLRLAVIKVVTKTFIQTSTCWSFVSVFLCSRLNIMFVLILIEGAWDKVLFSYKETKVHMNTSFLLTLQVTVSYLKQITLLKTQISPLTVGLGTPCPL